MLLEDWSGESTKTLLKPYKLIRYRDIKGALFKWSHLILSMDF